MDLILRRVQTGDAPALSHVQTERWKAGLGTQEICYIRAL